MVRELPCDLYQPSNLLFIVHTNTAAQSNRDIISSVLDNHLVEFTTHHQAMLGSIEGETAESLRLASNVASMTMTLAVLGLAGTFIVAKLSASTTHFLKSRQKRHSYSRPLKSCTSSGRTRSRPTQTRGKQPHRRRVRVRPKHRKRKRAMRRSC